MLGEAQKIKKTKHKAAKIQMEREIGVEVFTVSEGSCS